ncbi:aspartic protease precursor [Metarhizium acridum CQMa 102]|uniref:Aspartic protease n=2 Tax=Metarhizium acridum TaxID=92637 RepID=E9EGA6_METAQ|nr:aspartic protease precursor [Metarhizium acridum CQMa 102]EFY85058.1 aspartic protease precursor [Metarhizium acridum CQMa 102]
MITTAPDDKKRPRGVYTNKKKPTGTRIYLTPSALNSRPQYAVLWTSPPAWRPKCPRTQCSRWIVSAAADPLKREGQRSTPDATLARITAKTGLVPYKDAVSQRPKPYPPCVERFLNQSRRAMSLKTLLLLAAAHLALADSSHALFYKVVDRETAQRIASIKGLAAAGNDTPVFNDQGFWFSHFTVGASSDLEILIDTGSSDAILNPGIYKPSPGSVNANRRFRISYATTNPDGSGTLTASGNVYQDVITQLAANLSVAKQTLGDIQDPTSPPTFPRDGLIGYASQQGSALRGSPFINSLCDQGALSACRFGLALRPDKTGALYYGTVAADAFTGPLTTVPLTQGEWAVQGDVTVDGRPVQRGASIITDSGTTVVFGPTRHVAAVFAQAGVQAVPTSSGIAGYYNCSAAPAMGFSFGGANFDILPEALAFARSGDNCTAAVHGSDAFGDNWLVGQAFFQGRYIDHNVDDGTMGFADLK